MTIEAASRAIRVFIGWLYKFAAKNFGFLFFIGFSLNCGLITDPKEVVNSYYAILVE